MRWRLGFLGGSLRLEKGESLFARITNSMKGADDADAREHDYENEHSEQPDGIHVPHPFSSTACACKPTLSGTGTRFRRWILQGFGSSARVRLAWAL